MYDCIIIGAGPAGLTAAIYLARANKKTVVVDKAPGSGRAGITDGIVNYPGYKKVDGYMLVQTMTEQAEAFGAEFITDDILSVDAVKKTVFLRSGKVLEGKKLIVATGCGSKPLGLENEHELEGAGVSYCATCDGAFFRNRTVVVAGSNAKAEEEAKYLEPIVSKVYYVGSRNVAGEKIEKIDGNVTALMGNPLNKVEVTKKDGEKVNVDASGIFVSVGIAPNVAFLGGQVELDTAGYIICDEEMRTSVPGVFAAGDVRKKSLRQIVTAAADGAIAAMSAIKF